MVGYISSCYDKNLSGIEALVQDKLGNFEKVKQIVISSIAWGHINNMIFKFGIKASMNTADFCFGKYIYDTALKIICLLRIFFLIWNF